MNALEVGQPKESPGQEAAAAAAKIPEVSPKGFIGFPKSIITDANNDEEDIEVIHFGVV